MVEVPIMPNGIMVGDMAVEDSLLRERGLLKARMGMVERRAEKNLQRSV